MKDLKKEKELLDNQYKNGEILLSQYRDGLYNLEKKYLPGKLLTLKEVQEELIKLSDIKLNKMIGNKEFPFDNLPQEQNLNPLG